MKVEQVYALTNQLVQEVLGETAVLEQDLSNVVDIGKQIFDAQDVDEVTKTLINHIGRVKFVDRVYSGSVPSVLMDGWEFGSVLEKIDAELPDAEENPSWDLVDGRSYDPNIYKQPKVSMKLFNSKTTFEIDISLTDRQVRQSFSSAQQLNGFLSMLTNRVDQAMTMRLDGLIRAAINNMTAMTVWDAFGKLTPEATDTSVRAVNLLKLYKDEVDINSTLTPERALKDPEFIRFAVLKMQLYVARLATASQLFNMGNRFRFTPKDKLHVVMLSEFKAAASVYLLSDTFHQELTQLPDAETVAFWQGSGLDYGFAEASKIHVTTAKEAGELAGHEVSLDGILAVMFDHEAVIVANQDRRVTSNYNPKAEFTNNFYKQDAQFINDPNENYVVFFVK